MKALGLALTALVLLTPLTASAQPVNPLDILVKAGEAWEAFKAGDYAKALKAYRELARMAERMVEWLESKRGSAVGGSSKPVRLSNFELKVLEVRYPRYILYRGLLGSDYDVLTARWRSTEIVAVKVAVTNLGDKEETFDAHFELVTASGVKYEEHFDKLEYITSGDLEELKGKYPNSLVLEYGEVYKSYEGMEVGPRITVTFWIVFEVLKGKVPVGLEVRPWAGEKVYIPLSRG